MPRTSNEISASDASDSSGGPASQTVVPRPPAARIAEERAARILDRAAQLDARQRSEIDIDHLREAALGAGISVEAFEQALREQDRQDRDEASRSDTVFSRNPDPAALAHYTAVLRDLLGDEGRIAVVEDRLEWRDPDGLQVSLRSGGRTTVAAVAAEGRRRVRYLGIILPLLAPLVLTFGLAFAESGVILLFFGFLIALALSLVGTEVAYRRERKALRKKADLVRRQLQRLLGPGAADE